MSRITLRRLRQDAHIRALTREVRPHAEQFIQPLFVVEGISEREPIPGLTGVYRDTPASLLRQIESDLAAGCSKFLLFGVPVGRATHDIDWSFTAGQIAAIRKRFGQRRLARRRRVPLLLHAARPLRRAESRRATTSTTTRACANWPPPPRPTPPPVPTASRPSDMMDGRIGAIREALERDRSRPHAADELCGQVPFEVLRTVPRGRRFRAEDRARRSRTADRPRQLPDRSGTRGRCAAVRGARCRRGRGHPDGEAGPALPRHPRALSQQFPQPWAVYEVSGEYAGIELLAEQGLANRVGAHREAWTAFVRAGASMIISYGARHAREWLAQ